MHKLGVIIANTGSPEAPEPDAVREYLAEFLTDPNICPMHPAIWKVILTAFILPKRSEKSAKKYKLIWTEDGSPLKSYMSSLASKLDAASNSEGASNDIIVRYAMSYGSPSIKDVLNELHSLECEELLVIPLYPQSAFSTTKVVEDIVAESLATMDWNPKVEVIRGYSSNDAYLDAIAKSIEQSGFSSGDKLLMAFHSIPVKDINSGDTYVDQVDFTAAEIAKRLSLSSDDWRVGYQSRFDNRKWVGPFTDAAVKELDCDGRLFVIAPNFSIDCLETLFDIEVDLRERLKDSENSIHELVYIPCLNDSDEHVRVLQGLIESRSQS